MMTWLGTMARTLRTPDCVLIAIIGAALVLRMLGIGYGLPFTLFMDEYHEVMRALQLATGSFNLERAGKGGLYFILFVEFGILFVIQKITGHISDANQFAIEFVRDPTYFYMIGRITVAMIGAAGVAAVYLLARTAYGSQAGIISALLVAMNGLHVELSRVIGLDVMLLTFSTLSLFYALGVGRDGQTRHYVLAAVFAAIATTTKLPGILLVPILVLCHTYYVRNRQSPGSRFWIDQKFLLACALFVSVLVITNPGIVYGAKYLSLFATPDDTIQQIQADEGNELLASSAQNINLFYFYSTTILESLGLPLFCFAIAALLHALWVRTLADVVLVSYALINFVVISSTTTTLYYPRYALPIMMTMIVLSGRLLISIANELGKIRRLGILAMVLVLGYVPAYTAINNTVLSFQTDSRIMARDFIIEQIPPETKILIEGGKVGVKRSTVPLPESFDTLLTQYRYWKNTEPKQAKLLSYRMAAISEPGFDLVYIKPGDVHDLDSYIEQGVTVFVIQADSLNNDRIYGTDGRSLVIQLRNDKRIRQIALFPGYDHPRFGSTVEIYVLENTDLLVDEKHKHQFGT